MLYVLSYLPFLEANLFQMVAGPSLNLNLSLSVLHNLPTMIGKKIIFVRGGGNLDGALLKHHH